MEPHCNRTSLSHEEFNTLIRLVQAFELKKLEAERELMKRTQVRDAYYAKLAAKYNLPPTMGSISWDEDTLQIEVK